MNMNDFEKFQEQLERATDFVRRFPSFLESFGELAEQMGYVDKRTETTETGVATLILLTAIRKIIAGRSRNTPGVRLPSNAKYPHLSQEPF